MELLPLQAVGLAQQVSPLAAGELAAAATAAHPCSPRLWQQRLVLAQQCAGGGASHASAASEEDAEEGGASVARQLVAAAADSIRRDTLARGVHLP